jgi:hypothetical protein
VFVVARMAFLFLIVDRDTNDDGDAPLGIDWFRHFLQKATECDESKSLNVRCAVK